jgi:hypothetical protein
MAYGGEGMEYFAFLTVATIAIAALTWALYQKRGDIGLVVGSAALYYWSLYGAWFIVVDKTGGFSGQNYYYLERKLFPIVLDGNYMLTLGTYAGFIVLIQLTLLAALARPRRREIPRLVLRHGPILGIGALAAAGSLYLMGDKLSAAWALNASAHNYTRTVVDQWFTLHQVLNRVALIPPAIGFATLAAGQRSRYFVSVTRHYTFPAYGALFAGMATFTFVLGNKAEILSALLAGFLTYAASARRPRPWKVAAVVGAGLWFLASIDHFRGVPVTRLAEAVTEHLEETANVGTFLSRSNEAYGAHFSMYGVLASGTPPRFGYALYSLACSVIPRVLWPDRPRDTYLYYSESVGAIQDQGYSIHHATGWYLSFGFSGVAAGAVVLGLVWAYCLNAHQRIRPRSGLLFRLFAVIAPWVFVACLPALIRSGPEGYKGFGVDGLLTPMGALAFACRPRKQPPAKRNPAVA